MEAFLKYVTTAVFCAAVCTSSAPSQAQNQPTNFANVEIRSIPLGNGVYMLTGQGGNITVAIGDDAIIQVDDEFAPLHDKIKAAIDRLSGGKPIKYVINTHFHPDHTGGNLPFSRDGATLVAHRNLALRLAHGTTNALNSSKTEPADRAAVPGTTYTTDGMQLMVKGQTAFINHPLSAHTDTDSYVYFPAANVIATGDVVSLFRDRYVTIDVSNGGSINGIIATVETYLRLGSDQTKYVPGHGPLATRADLQKYHDLLMRVRDSVDQEMKAGKTEEQAIADRPLKAISAELHINQDADDTMVKMVYRSLKGTKANPA
jgi:glyoxylase-like metal-dependent hydrolase (beta-lactamase superfamily II)